MANAGITERVAGLSAARPWFVVAAWAALFVTGGFLASGVGDALTNEISLTNEPESVRATRLLEERLRGPEQAREIVVVSAESAAVDDPAFEAFVAALLGDVRKLDGTVESATSYFETGDETMVSAGRDRTILPVVLKGDADEAVDTVAPLVALLAQRNGESGFEVLTVGRGSIEYEATEISEKDLQRGEMIGIPIALVILLLVFGSAVAAGLPILTAVVSIVIAIGIVALLGRAFQFNFSTVNMVTMIGLAVGIDYSLFVIHRFREERAAGRDRAGAIAVTGATANRAVLFSGGTVIVGLAGMLIVPSNIYRSLAVGAIIVAIVAILAALTLLPAVLSILGDQVNALRIPFLQRGGASRGPGFWGRIANAVMARPLLFVVVTVTLLLLAAAPALALKSGLPGVSTFPEDSQSRRAFEILDAEFSAGLISPTEVVVTAEDVNARAVTAAIASLQAAFEQDPVLGESTVQVNDAGDLAVISVLIRGDANSDVAYDAVDRIRGEYIPAAFAGVDAEVLVTGDSALADDMFDVIAQYTPIVFAFVLGLSFVLLMVVFRSIVVPIKALIMNLLSVGAAYGLIVLVFQYGVGAGLLGFQETESIAAWLPLFLFAVLFGLSMDYHVFLLSRIRERFDQTRDNAASVIFGVTTTSGIITGAAAIMVAVFAGFAMGDLPDLQQVGFGLAVAVLLDATVIRSVLVPASMKLLGDLNWYLPSWLNWLPDVRVEAAAPGRTSGPSVESPLAAGGD